jgi:hypothetical protein
MFLQAISPDRLLLWRRHRLKTGGAVPFIGVFRDVQKCIWIILEACRQVIKLVIQYIL